MRWIRIVSDQSINWSDYHERKVNCNSSTKAEDTAAKTAPFGSCSPWIFNRALQALWQAWLQLCTWTGPRAQVLFVSEQVWTKAPDGLCSPGLPGKSTRVFGQLPQDKGYPGRALRDQQGTFASQGEVVTKAPPSLRGHCDGNLSGRCGRDSHSLRQYARRSDEIRFRPILGQGGQS